MNIDTFSPHHLSKRTIIRRINRKLAKNYEKLHECRKNSRAYSNLGDYYIVDTYRNTIIRSSIEDFEGLARDVGVIAQWETLAE
jgi:hypothetical protein